MRGKLAVPARRGLTVIGAAVTALVMAAAPALAHHQPVLLDESDVLPWRAPLALDGTDALGFMGVVPHAGAVRSAQFDMDAGDEIVLTYLTRGAAPEIELSDAELPLVLLLTPDNQVVPITPDMRELAGPQGFELLRLREYRATAVAGRYSIVVVGVQPARFIVNLGEEGNHEFHGVERGEIASDQEALEWFTTLP